MWVRKPAEGDLVMVQSKDIVNPDLIDDLVTDGFSFENKYETSASDLSCALAQSSKTSDEQAKDFASKVIDAGEEHESMKKLEGDVLNPDLFDNLVQEGYKFHAKEEDKEAVIKQTAGQSEDDEPSGGNGDGNEPGNDDQELGV